VVDGFYWSSFKTVAGLRFKSDIGAEIIGGTPIVDDSTTGVLTVTWPTKSPQGQIVMKFTEASLTITATGNIKDKWLLDLTYDKKADLPFTKIEPQKLSYTFKGANYTVSAQQGTFTNKAVSTLQIIPKENHIVLDLSIR